MIQKKEDFKLWAFSDAHVGTDIKWGKRKSLKDALYQSEFGGEDGGPPFEWDIAVDAGDMSGAGGLPEDREGKEIVKQFGILKKHRREDIYNVSGNHDRSGVNEKKNHWWRKWVDPTGENTEFSSVDPKKRPYTIEGTWERYTFQVGNILFLMMSDINEPTQKIGRGDLGGNPGGVVSGETFKWWKRKVEENPDLIKISMHHYMLKDTTVASGKGEQIVKKRDGTIGGKYHGYHEQGTPEGAAYLYWVDSIPDAEAFEQYLAANPGAIDIWIGGHTHTYPDDCFGGKSRIEKKWGVQFINAGQLTRYHVYGSSLPMSRVLTFTRGSRNVRVRYYLHTSEYKPQGWYEKKDRVISINRCFDW